MSDEHTPGPLKVEHASGAKGTWILFGRGAKIVGTACTRGDAMLFKNAAELHAALQAAERLCREALPKFNWGGSALDANAIELLNIVPRRIEEALSKVARDQE